MSAAAQDGSGPHTEDLFGPIRDQYIVAFLTAIRRARQADAEVTIEPIRKNRQGGIGRAGMLNLPRRDDGTKGGTAASEALLIDAQIQVHEHLQSLTVAPGMVCDVLPFVWNDVWLSTRPPCESSLLMRIRLWYLDWFQARHTEPTRSLSGAVHRLDGPFEHDGAHWLHLDLGTAPSDALTTLLELLAASQISRSVLGKRPPFG